MSAPLRTPPGSRRTKWHTITALVAMLLITACIPAVSAESFVIDIDESKTISNNYEVSGQTTPGTPAPYTLHLYNYNMYAPGDPLTLIWFGSIITNNDTLKANSTNIKIMNRDGTQTAHGDMGYFKNANNEGYIYINIVFDDYPKSIVLDILDESNKFAWESLDRVRSDGYGMHNNGLTSDNPAGFSGSYTSGVYYRITAGTYTLNTVETFKQLIYVDELTSISDRIQILRNIDGTTFASHVTLSGKSGDYINEYGTEDYDMVLGNPDRPYKISIYGLGKWYNNTVFGNGDDPGEIPVSAVTVYVRNSQTGALLAGAHILVEGTPGVDNWTEYVNTTLPSGTGSYSLPGMPYQFRILAESPGYTSTGYQYFRAGDTVIVNLEPYIDAPTNGSNTFLEFYIRDLNANPLGGATVEVGGQWLYSNNNGYARFEVAKNATYSYTVQKSGYMTISGTATVADGPRYTVNVVLGAGTVPTLTPTQTAPGATPTPTPTGWGPGQWTPDPDESLGDNARGAAKQTLLEGLQAGQLLFTLCILVLIMAVLDSRRR